MYFRCRLFGHSWTTELKDLELRSDGYRLLRRRRVCQYGDSADPWVTEARPPLFSPAEAISALDAQLERLEEKLDMLLEVLAVQ